MDKHAVAIILEEIGTLLEVHGENKFKARAFINAARAVEKYESDLGALVRRGEVETLPGVGPATANVVRELVTTGTSRYYTDLRERTPDGLLELLAVPRLGASRIRTLHQELGVASLADLEAAALQGRIASLPGFGARTQERILEGIAYVRTTTGRRRLAETLELGRRLTNFVRAQEHVLKAELAGELRRCCETVNAVEVVACVQREHMDSVLSAFAALPGIAHTNRNRTSITAHLSDGLTLRLTCAPPESFPVVLVFRTGSRTHVDELVESAQAAGFGLSPENLTKGGAVIPVADEQALYRVLGLAWVAPELREGRGELEFAARNEIPQLVELSDLRGCFHCHTTYSDGTASVAEMARGAQSLGWRYLGIADHSQHASYAGGLSLDELGRQHEEIDAWNAEHGKKLWLFKGVEADILADGAVDYARDDVLQHFDYVIGSVHSNFNLSAEAMTERFLRALDNPYLTMLGHLTGRLLLSRKGYALDIPRVLEAAAERGVAVEINADPRRLDLGWEHWRETAPELFTAINPDAHSVRSLDVVEYGVAMARKGGIGPGRIVNTWTLAQVRRFFQRARRS